jgi:hypothetical protein
MGVSGAVSKLKVVLQDAGSGAVVEMTTQSCDLLDLQILAYSISGFDRSLLIPLATLF